MKIKSGIALKLTLIFLLFIAIASSVYFYYQYTQIKKQASAGEIENIMLVLSKYIQLPNEIPTLATVTDKTKLENQLFFQNSQNGDKLIIFTQSSKAILYRPSIKKIIEVSNLLVATTEPGTQTENNPTPTLSQKIALALYNGTKEIGLASKVEKQIFKDIDYFKVVVKQDAKKNNYSQTLVINISGKYTKIAETLSQSLSAKLSSLPQSESKPKADILIILGQDRL